MDNEKDKSNIQDPTPESEEKSSYGGSRYRWQYDEYRKELEEKEKAGNEKSGNFLGAAILAVFIIAITAVVSVFITDAVLRSKGSSLAAYMPWGKETEETESLPEHTEDCPTCEEIESIAKNTAVHLSIMGKDGNTGSASGVLISGDGYIVTTAHVLAEGGLCTVRTHSGNTYPADIIGMDTDLDVALLKIDADDLVTAEIGMSANAENGESVTAIRVSEANKECEIFATEVKGREGNVIFIDGEIGHGSCGGPVLDKTGRLIGIISANENSASGSSAAIGIDHILPMVSGLMTQGVISSTVWNVQALELGVKMVTLEQSELYGIPKGCLIYSIVKGGRAELLGLCKGDIIVGINGTGITDCQSIEELICSGENVYEVYRLGQVISISEKP